MNLKKRYTDNVVLSFREIVTKLEEFCWNEKKFGLSYITSGLFSRGKKLNSAKYHNYY